MQDAFENFMDEVAREIGGDWFDGKLAGVKFRNADGRDRQQILRSLKQQDELELRPEPENPFDPRAIAVYSPQGEQVGYLESRTARELSPRMAKGVTVRCFVRTLRRGPEGTGVSIGLAQSKPVYTL